MYILHFFVHGLRGEDTGVSTVYDGLRRSTTTLGIYDSAEKRAIGSLFEIPSQIRSVYAFLRGPPIFGNSKPNKKRLITRFCARCRPPSLGHQIPFTHGFATNFASYRPIGKTCATKISGTQSGRSRYQLVLSWTLLVPE